MVKRRPSPRRLLLAAPRKCLAVLTLDVMQPLKPTEPKLNRGVGKVHQGKNHEDKYPQQLFSHCL